VPGIDLGGLAAVILVANASRAELQVVLPKEPPPKVFAPLDWQTTPEQLSELTGEFCLTQYDRTRGNAPFVECTVERAALGKGLLVVKFLAGPLRFTSVTITYHADDEEPVGIIHQPDEIEPPSKPSLGLLNIFKKLTHDLVERYGPARTRSHASIWKNTPPSRLLTWRRAGYEVRLVLAGPDEEEDTWSVVVNVLLDVQTPEGRRLSEEELWKR
jgi:hypothetical protein